jgi:PIN domain nuclease of toxin-antitoxin system
MTIVIDANVAIAVLNRNDAFHRTALRTVLGHDDVRMLNLTRAEAMIRPTQLGRHLEAAAEFDRLGLQSVVLDDATADRGRQLRSDHSGKGFPLIDAVVVALGMELACTVVTCDAKWPAIPEASIELLAAE